MFVKLFIAFTLTISSFAKAAGSDSAQIKFWSYSNSCNISAEMVSETVSPDWVAQHLNKIRKDLTPAQKRVDTKIQKKGLLQKIQAVIKWHHRAFTKVISSAGEDTNQEKSGDCWIHAATNDFKSDLIRRGIVKKDFQFSRNFFYFYSTLEKTNTYFQELINLKPTSLNDEVFSSVLKLTDTEPEFHISDGGEFSWMLFLISKYGLAPYDAMPDTNVSLDTDPFIHVLREIVISVNRTLTDKINSYGPVTEFTAAQKQELNNIKKRGLQKVVEYLARTLGLPPDRNNLFKFQTNIDKPKEKPVYLEFDPLGFARDFMKFDSSSYVSMSSTPLQPYNQSYAIQQNGSVGITDPGQPKYNEHFVNVNTHRLAQLVKKMIDADRAVYFAADVTKDVDVKSGIMDPRLFRTKQLLDIRTRKVSRRAAVNAGLYSPDHAMAFIGYETDKDGNIIRFKVRNSWGTKVGEHGDFSMSIEWFHLYVFEASIDKSLISRNERNLWENPSPTPITSFDKYYGPN